MGNEQQSDKEDEQPEKAPAPDDRPLKLHGTMEDAVEHALGKGPLPGKGKRKSDK